MPDVISQLLKDLVGVIIGILKALGVYLIDGIRSIAKSLWDDVARPSLRWLAEQIEQIAKIAFDETRKWVVRFIEWAFQLAEDLGIELDWDPQDLFDAWANLLPYWDAASWLLPLSTGVSIISATMLTVFGIWVLRWILGLIPTMNLK